MNHHGCLINKARFDTLNLSRGMAAAACLGFYGSGCCFSVWGHLLRRFLVGLILEKDGRVCVAFDKL